MSKYNWVIIACGIPLMLATMAMALPAQTFTKIHTFSGTDGGSPDSAMVRATNGSLYGATAYGGTTDENAGTIYKITTAGRLTSLYSFCVQSGCPDGKNPFSALVQARNGDFYGTTLNGGVGGPCVGNMGCGVVFKITSAGTFTTLYSFCTQSNCIDGEFPSGGLVLGTDGNLYGVTSSGGTTAGCPAGCGTFFRITPGGKLTTLHDFCSESECVDGVAPGSALSWVTTVTSMGQRQAAGALAVESYSRSLRRAT